MDMPISPPDEPLADVEVGIKKALSALIDGAPSAALVREAMTELSQAELSSLGVQQRDNWASLSAPGRRLEWSEARRCEKAIRERLGGTAETSVAHTRKGERAYVFAIGALTAGPGGRSMARVGIDVEHRSRQVTEAVARRFMRDGEERWGLEPLQIWVVKEALFKADPENAGTTISAHSLVSFERSGQGIGQGMGSIAGREARFSLLQLADWVVAVAVSRKPAQSES